MVLRQKSSGIIFGSDVWLGTVKIDGKLREDFVDNFEEIEDVKENSEEE